MPDKFDKRTRSAIMSKIKGKDTSLEVNFRKLLWKRGLKGYRTHYALPGKPDIAFVSRKIAIFLDGDFWHGYNWKELGKDPPKGYWRRKLQKNIESDKKHNRQLRKNGWAVIRLWEHEIKKSPEECIKTIKSIWKNRNGKHV